MERACFRFFGLKSHAVHINGFRADGHMWCGRRALTKATDPGKLDNLAAGGLPAGETVQLCGIREMAEEAGLQAGLAEQAIACGEVTTNRMEPEGWHHEALWVYNLAMPMDVLPQNQDGEVSEFLCMSPHEVMAALRQQAFSVDAGCVIAQGVLGSDIALQSP
jgi:8-oxo-dGTP pyrophosphatase MutT (NUDIX family)